jgi:hypothetical protein
MGGEDVGLHGAVSIMCMSGFRKRQWDSTRDGRTRSEIDSHHYFSIKSAAMVNYLARK